METQLPVITTLIKRIRKRNCIVLRHPYSTAIYAALRNIPGCEYDRQQKQWIVADTAEIRQLLRESMQGIAILKKDKNSPPKAPAPNQLTAGFTADKESWIANLKTNRYSDNTIKVYGSALDLFGRWLNGRNHKEIRQEDIDLYMQDLVLQSKVSLSYQNQHINALRSFYSVNYNIHFSSSDILRPRREYKLPNYFSRSEVALILSSIRNLKHQTMLSLVYAAGLRAGELCNLKIRDINPEAHTLRVVNGKGKKDRVVGIPPSILQMLEKYGMAYKPKTYVFEGQQPGEPYSYRSLQQVFKKAIADSKLQDKETAALHWLRHSYATHMLERGINIRTIQELLGHKHLGTTEIYTHVSSVRFNEIPNPFDDLPGRKRNLDALKE
jgi:integrase/recombinase XerD